MEKKITLKEQLAAIAPGQRVKIIYTTEKQTLIGSYERKAIEGCVSSLAAEYSRKMLKKIAEVEVLSVTTEITMLTSHLIDAFIVIELVDKPITFKTIMEEFKND